MCMCLHVYFLFSFVCSGSMRTRTQSTQNNSVLEVQVVSSGDLSVVSVPQGDSEVEDWVVVYDYPKHTEIEAGLQEHAAAEQVRSCKIVEEMR